MQEPIISCPKCKTEIKLTESLAAPLIEATRKQFEQRITASTLLAPDIVTAILDGRQSNRLVLECANSTD